MRVRTRRAVLTSAIVTVVVAIGAITGFSLSSPGGSVKAAGTPTQTPVIQPVARNAYFNQSSARFAEHDLLVVPVYSSDGGAPKQLAEADYLDIQKETEDAAKWWNEVGQGAVKLKTVILHKPIELPADTQWCEIDPHARLKKILGDEFKPSTIMIALVNDRRCGFGGIELQEDGITINTEDGSGEISIIAHEIGHALGLHHSNDLYDAELFFGKSGDQENTDESGSGSSEYADFQSIMGSSHGSVGLPTIGQLYEAGFPTNAKLVTETGSQDYLLDSRSSFTGPNAQALGIPYKQGDKHGNIWLENRQPSDLDSIMKDLPTGIQVMFVQERMSPDELVYSERFEIGDASLLTTGLPLAVGQKWSSPDSSITIECISNGPVAKVRVTTTPKAPELLAEFDSGDRVMTSDGTGKGTVYVKEIAPSVNKAMVDDCDLSVAAFGSPALNVAWEESKDGGHTWTGVGNENGYVCQDLPRWPDVVHYRAVIKNSVGELTTPAVRAYSVKTPIHQVTQGSESGKNAVGDFIFLELDKGSFEGSVTGIRWVHDAESFSPIIGDMDLPNSPLSFVITDNDLDRDGQLTSYALVYYGSHAVMSKLSGS